MKITLHDGRIISEPTDVDVDTLFADLADPGDFIILSDERGGEIRAAGPQNGRFLLQCDLPTRGGTFAGERRDVGIAEATGVFREFLAGQTHWSGQFGSREARSSGAVRVVLFLVVVVAAVLLLLRYLAV